MVDPWLTKKRVERMKNDYWPKNFMLPKTIRFVWNNSYIGACVSVIGACVLVITAWWPYAKFYFLVNRKIWLRIDQKNLQFTVDRRHYWPKVPNILRTYLSIQNVHFPLLWDFFRNLLEKVPHCVQGSKISRISGHQGSQCVTWSC